MPCYFMISAIYPIIASAISNGLVSSTSKVLDQGIGVDAEKYRIGTFLWILAKFLVYEFQVLFI